MSIPALDIVQVSRRFGGVLAVDEATFTVEAGSITALIGPNGAGKTTLFNAITNVFPPSAGSVHFFGHDLKGLSGEAIARLGLVRTFQTARVFPGMTVLENVLAGAQLHVRSPIPLQMLWAPRALREERDLTRKALELLDLVGLSGLRHRPASDLPMGAQKNLEVMRALMAGPRMMLLDEPAAGLNDTETGQLSLLLSAIQASGITLMLVEHNMSLVMGIADKVVVLDAGKMLAIGSPQAIQSDARVIEAYMG